MVSKKESTLPVGLFCIPLAFFCISLILTGIILISRQPSPQKENGIETLAKISNKHYFKAMSENNTNQRLIDDLKKDLILGVITTTRFYESRTIPAVKTW